MLTHCDLFAGIGGFSLAAERTVRIQTAQLVELDRDAQTILKDHFPGVPIHGDIRTYHARRGEFDIITAGFPCTGTSQAGNRTGLQHLSAGELGAGHQRRRIFIVSYPYIQQAHYQVAPRWSEQMRDLVEAARACAEWTKVESRDDGLHPRFPADLVGPFVPANSPGRLNARYLAGRTVTPWQAAVVLQRVLFLASL